MNHVIIILNYNDWKTTSDLISKIQDYAVFDKLIMVDNASSDDSVEQLRKLQNDKVELIVNSENRGYANGNNFGIFYAIRTHHPKYITIANPDIYVEEKTMEKILEVFDKDSAIGLATALVQKGYNAWKLPGFFGVLQSLFPMQRFLKKYLCRKKMLKSNREYEYVDVIEGSMFCARAEAMEKAGGFDGKTFLYVEENLLAARMRRNGYRSVILPHEIYYHFHSVSVGKHYKKKTQIFHFISQSYYIFCTDYLKINGVQKLIFKGAVRLAFMERELFDCLMQIKEHIKG